MINETTIGGEFKGKPIKTFPEVYEIKIRQMVQKCLSKETRTDGEEVFVVGDLDTLILDIMNFYEEKGIKS